MNCWGHEWPLRVTLPLLQSLSSIYLYVALWNRPYILTLTWSKQNFGWRIPHNIVRFNKATHSSSVWKSEQTKDRQTKKKKAKHILTVSTQIKSVSSRQGLILKCSYLLSISRHEWLYISEVLAVCLSGKFRCNNKIPRRKGISSHLKGAVVAIWEGLKELSILHWKVIYELFI